MKASRVAIAVATLASLLCIGVADGNPPRPAAWEKTDEAALRTLIASSGIVLETYLDRNGFPHQRLRVPNEFVTLYRKDSDQCLAVLLEIVRRDKPHDAKVAFLFGMAGDEPQLVVPLFVFVKAEELDRPDGEGTETYREYFTTILEREKARRTSDQKTGELGK